MDTDLVLTAGILILALSLPALLSAWAESRLSRLGVAMVAAAVGMIAWAVYAAPTPYALEDIPQAMLGVLGRIIN